MVAPTKQQQQHHQQPAATTTTAEEEALKRDTDCVYFLASPLTCKKGSECEYRHSEYARVNPRDCYYWLNGNCLNPKCSYRHPPLDSLFGTQAATSSGSSLVPSHPMVVPATRTPHNPSKPGVPCIFFQKGLCLKGDKCAYLHGLHPSGDKASEVMAPAPGTEPASLKKAFGGLKKCTQGRNMPVANLSKAVENLPEAKPAPKVEVAPPRYGLGVEKNVLPPKSMDGGVSRYKTTNFPQVVNGNSQANCLHQSQVVDDHVFQNGKDGDDFLRESSPGFDVLVDDELRESDYYHGEDQYQGTTGPEGRNLNSMDEYDMDHSTDYNSIVDVDEEAYREPRDYDPYEPMQGQYAWEHQRASLERIIVGPAHQEGRGYAKANSPQQLGESDLRYRLSKHRRVNGLRSVVSHDFVPGNHVEDHGYRSSSQRDSHHAQPHESSISSRFRGRIKLPVRSTNNGSELRTEVGEVDRGRNWGRLSPGRSQICSQQGRLHDRMKARVEEDLGEGRNFRGSRMSREIVDHGSSDFAAPKSLAALKVVKNVEGRVQQSLGKRKYLEDQPSEANSSFEGPMPLSEILKRKREAEAAASAGGIASVIKDDDNHKGSRESLILSCNNKAVAEPQNGLSSVLKGRYDGQLHMDKEESKSASGSATPAEVENAEGACGQSSQLPNPIEIEAEEGIVVDEGMGDREYEGDDQRDEEYEYEQGDEGDYNYEEGENVDPEEDYVDEEEDGNDFASKMGVIFS